MKNSNFISLLFAIAIFTLGFLAFSAWSWYEDQGELPYYGKKKEFAKQLRQAKSKGFKPIAEFSFINQDSNAIGSKDLKGKVWVADFFFTRCPSICPVMTNNLELVQDAYLNNDNLKILSFTCDPEHDRPAQLSNYAAAFQANTRQWQFITGDKTELYRFARNELFITATDGDGGPTDFIHEQYLVLVDKNGYVRGFYDGTKPYEVKILIRDIQKLL